MCERESHMEAGEETAKVGWTRGQNGRTVYLYVLYPYIQIGINDTLFPS